MQGERASKDVDAEAEAADAEHAAPETLRETEKASSENAVEADQRREAADFVFAAGGRAVRFVWKIDAEGHFSEISEEFASAVGPKAADVIGVTFTELAGRYGLDPDNRINELLHRRDTWSGKTIFWPVQGTNLKVPVDLAALPTYSRSREFDGFRGFGIVRVADAVPDAKAAGLSLDRAPAQKVERRARGCRRAECRLSPRDRTCGQAPCGGRQRQGCGACCARSYLKTPSAANSLHCEPSTRPTGRPPIKSSISTSAARRVPAR